MQPLITNDAVIFGLLMIILAGIVTTAASKNKYWQRFYIFFPALLLCYFIPAFLHWPLGLIAPTWYDLGALSSYLKENYFATFPSDVDWKTLHAFIVEHKITTEELSAFEQNSSLYFVASRYLLPASLILLTLSIDLKALKSLGLKPLLIFLTGSAGVIIGGPIAIIIVQTIAPGLIRIDSQDLWKGLSTMAGSWIGGGANQTAMKEIYQVADNLFATIVVVDVLIANIWMGFLLYGAGITKKIDKWLKADNTAIEQLLEKVKDYRASIERIPQTKDLMLLTGIVFGGVGLSHFGADVLSVFMGQFETALIKIGLNTVMEHFFWLVVIATTFGLWLSFTKMRKLEGIGASRWATVFIYMLVATIGMKMNISEIWQNIGLVLIALIWILIHALLMLIVSKLTRSPFFFMAVGSTANVGGAASAPIVATAFNPALAPVGVLLAVLGYAIGTYGGIIAALLMQWVS
ncbi:MAG TPA: hypothetical protein DCX89_03755 [Saprospirales bacterium]|nr:hypothetical protein [Saprospirales bacterium]HAY70981.1 hypothetical protein [Saprospirales bacterium]